MGVHGLWELLAPVGRRVSVETLSNKKLAIDASIWIVQFLKAMRDDRGEVLRNAHLLGFFRRICKLLYLRVKPVFVFDGGTPFLKRRTVIARRRQREQAQAKIRKTAEKLLLNHLKARKLEELVREEEQRGLPKQQNREAPETQSQDRRDDEGETNNGSDNANKSQEDADALLAASLQQKEWDDAPIDMQAEEDVDSGDEDILPVAQGKIDPTVLGALPPSMQLRLLDEMREQLVAENRQKFAKVAKAPASFSEMQIEAYLKTVAFRREIVEVQKAAGNKGVGGVPSTKIASEVNREYIFSSSQQDDKETNRTVPTRQVVHVPPVEQQSKEGSVEVQTYIDGRGQKRVSKIRGMGVRMTRDLQWNLYLMKDKEKNSQLAEERNEAEDDAYLAALDEQSQVETGEVGNDGGHDSDIEILEQAPRQAPNEHSGFEDTEIEWEEADGKGTSGADITGMEFTLENDGSADPDDEIFKSLVLSAPPAEENGEEEDIEWEESITPPEPAPGQPASCPAPTTQETPQQQEVTDLGAWEQLYETENRISEEEQQLEEAIRRSVLDFGPRTAFKPLKIQDPGEAGQEEQKNEDRCVSEGDKMERERARKGKALLTVEATAKDKIQELPLSTQDTSAAVASTDEYKRRNEVPPDANMEEEVRARRLAELEEAKERLFEEESQLRSEQKNNERNAESVSSEMFSECQELLQLFGLPYVVAPMEAEAQCAFLDSAELVDGVITDDSDVFLFGARSVYKNIFDGHKYVETYFMKDVEADLGLNQDKLIHMAMLLGSDYTEGISGIGIVNAIEVVNAFPQEDGLTEFREWIDSPDLMLLDKLNLKASKTDAQQRPSEVDEKKRKFMKKHRAVSKNWTVPPSFPSKTVIEAYSSPQVDKSTETFSWGRPDLDCLRKFCFEKFSWTREKADELLLPVLKEYDRRETQLRLDAFYTFNERFAKIRSRRIQKAVTDITGRRVTEIMDASADIDPPVKKKRRGKNSESAENDSVPKTKEAGAANPSSKRQKKTSTATGAPGKRSRARKQVNQAAEEAGQDREAKQPELASVNEERQEAEIPSLQEPVMDANVNSALTGGFIVEEDGGRPVEAAAAETDTCTVANEKLDADEVEGETRLLAMPFLRRKRKS